MPFVSFSSQLVIDNATAVSNIFMEEYLPTCNGDCARIYLYGLYLCGSATRYDNTLEHIAESLKLDKEDVVSAFVYWQEQGLVKMLSAEPMQIKYLPVKSNVAKLRKNASKKYADFNTSMEALIEGRMITPNEFSEYYTFLETHHVEPAALVMIAAHCVNIKGPNVGYKYILTVATNWAAEDVKTVASVDEKLKRENELELAKQARKRKKDEKKTTVTKHSYAEEDLKKLVTNIDEVKF